MKIQKRSVVAVGGLCGSAGTEKRGPRSGHRERVKEDLRGFGQPHRLFFVLLAVLAGCVLGVAESFGQYGPDLTVSQTQGVNESDYFFLGPTGMRGWMYYSSQTRNARQILVTQVPAGSPADGVMLRHDVILGIGEDGMFPHDARVAFVDALIAAEGGDGKLHLNVYRPSTEETSVRTIQLGITNAPLAATSPYDCDKALAILTNYCARIVAVNGPLGHPTREFSIWAMLGSGIKEYEDWAIDWIRKQTPYSRTNLSIYRPVTTRNWDMSYMLATLAQYYLFMKNVREDPDEDVLPAIENLAQFIAQGQDRRGQWGHTYAYPSQNGGQLHGTLPGYGALNNAGLVSLYGLALTQKCGITNNAAINAAVEKSAAFFRANVGIGTINYGFHDPIPSVTDVNGRMGIAAAAFRALGDVEAAKWFAMMTSTYGWRNWGHTGNEFNHAWGPLAANVGGPELVKFVHTNRNYNAAFDVDQPYHQVTLHMLRQPNGSFQSQGQGGQGPGRSNGHATGSYALQMAIPASTIDVSGGGYEDAFWLTEDEMEQVRIGFHYESNPVNHLSNEELIEHLGNFSPRVFNKMADELRSRMNADLRHTLIAIVEDAGAKDTKRVAALRALDSTGRETVKVTTDTWYAPSSYVLNYGARNHAFRDHASNIKMLEAIAQFDRSLPFDMLVVGNYASALRNIKREDFTGADLDTYYAAVEVILSPDAGNVFDFVENQGIPGWDPDLLARFADSILRVADMPAMAYNAGRVLATPPIGEGMYSWMVRSGHTAQTSQLDTSSHFRNYGMHAMIYTNHLRRLKAQGFSYDHYVNIDELLEFYLPPRGYPTLHWFRDLIAANVAADHPGASDEDLRALLAASSDQADLYRAVVLDKLVTQIGTDAAFADILPYVGFRSPIIGTNWRLYRGAVEIGTNTTYSTDEQWLDALDTVDLEDHVRIGGILHVLAGRGVAAAKALAENFLLHDNEFVTVAALDVYRAVGTEDDLVMLFNQFMTNVSSEVEGEVTFAHAFTIHAYWDAIHAIVERDSPISSTIANQIAAAFNEQTKDGSDMTGIANAQTPLAEPISILNPVGSNVDKVYGQYVTGPIGILGLFPGTDCDQALWNVYSKTSDSQHWGRNHKYAASEAFMRQLSHGEIIQRQQDKVSSPWNDRIATLYLLMELLQERVPVEVQLDLLTLQYNNLPLQGGSSAYPRGTAQNELNRRRGLEERRAVHYFYAK